MDDRNKLPPENNPEAGLGKEPIHVLLVEDEEAHAELVRRAFELHTGRFRLTMASNLEEAQACLSQGSPPDLIITDLVTLIGRRWRCWMRSFTTLVEVNKEKREAKQQGGKSPAPSKD